MVRPPHSYLRRAPCTLELSNDSRRLALDNHADERAWLSSPSGSSSPPLRSSLYVSVALPTPTIAATSSERNLPGRSPASFRPIVSAAVCAALVAIQ